MSESNLGTQLHRIICRANLEPWPIAFNSLRSTRQTELEEIYPRHVVCAWFGKSSAIAEKNYLQVTEEHFFKALHNPVQQSLVLPRTPSQASQPAQTKTPVLQGSASECDVVHFGRVEDRGPEPDSVRRYSGKDLGNSPSGRAAKSRAVGSKHGPMDPELRYLVERWDDLPAPVKAGILVIGWRKLNRP